MPTSSLASPSSSERPPEASADTEAVDAALASHDRISTVAILESETEQTKDSDPYDDSVTSDSSPKINVWKMLAARLGLAGNYPWRAPPQCCDRVDIFLPYVPQYELTGPRHLNDDNHKVDYEVYTLIANQAYASVYAARARPREKGRPFPKVVSVKAYWKGHLFASSLMFSQVCREVKMMKEFSTEESLCDLLAVFQDTNYVYLVTRLYPCTLQELSVHMRFTLERGLSVSTQDARFYAAELITSLERLHSRGISHANITPDNFLVSPSGHLALTGFDHFTKPSEFDFVYERTRCFWPGSKVSFLYCAPEYFSHVPGYDKPKFDLWSLGVTLLEFCLGMSSPYFLYKDCLPKKDGWLLDPKATSSELYMEKKLRGWEFSKQKAPKALLDPQVWDFLKGLLEKNTESRMSLEEAMSHPLFKDSDESERSFSERYPRTAEPPFQPSALQCIHLHGDIHYTKQRMLSLPNDRPLPPDQSWQALDSWSAPPEVLSGDATRRHGRLALSRTEKVSRALAQRVLKRLPGENN